MGRKGEKEKSKLSRHPFQTLAAFIGQMSHRVSLVESEPGKCSASADLNKFRGSICKKERGDGYCLGS